jgi:3-oxoacyl-(acyl-carrier-protein) synthase
MRRVVITGIGLVTPLGLGKPSFEQLIAKKSGIIGLTGSEYSALPSRVAAKIEYPIQTEYSVCIKGRSSMVYLRRM